MKQILASVISNNEVMPCTHLVWLEAHTIAAAARPGQFVMVHCGEETMLRRPLSIHRVDGDKLALLFAIVGKGTRWLSQRKIGDTLDIFGPLGNGFTLPDSRQHILLVAGGIGIAPLTFLLDKAIEQGVVPKLLMGARSSSLLYSKHMNPPRRDLAKVPSETPDLIAYETITITEAGSEGEEGLVIDLLPQYVDWADQIFACGPLPMYQAMAQMQKLKNKHVQVSLETRMGCGFGVCYGCTVKTKNGLKQVCKNGPVFDLKDILWDELNC